MPHMSHTLTHHLTQLQDLNYKVEMVLIVSMMVDQVAALLTQPHLLVQVILHQFLHLKEIQVALQIHQVLQMILAEEAVVLQQQEQLAVAELLKELAVLVHQMQYQVQQ